MNDDIKATTEAEDLENAIAEEVPANYQLKSRQGQVFPSPAPGVQRLEILKEHDPSPEVNQILPNGMVVRRYWAIRFQGSGIYENDIIIQAFGTLTFSVHSIWSQTKWSNGIAFELLSTPGDVLWRDNIGTRFNTVGKGYNSARIDYTFQYQMQIPPEVFAQAANARFIILRDRFHNR